MYGSLQFESIINSDRELRAEQTKEQQILRFEAHMANRLKFFNEIVNTKLLQYWICMHF